MREVLAWRREQRKLLLAYDALFKLRRNRLRWLRHVNDLFRGPAENAMIMIDRSRFAIKAKFISQLTDFGISVRPRTVLVERLN